jgi:hypothetical protein
VTDWAALTYEERMARREVRRASPEYQARVKALRGRIRHREIWRAIRAADADGGIGRLREAGTLPPKR